MCSLLYVWTYIQLLNFKHMDRTISNKCEDLQLKALTVAKKSY